MVSRAAPVLWLTLLTGCIPEVAPPPDTPRHVPVAGPVREQCSRAVPPLSLRRGINAGDALDAPTEGEWGVVLEPPLFDAIAAAGFDHVRVPIRYSGHAAAAPPYAVDEAFLRRVDWAIDQVLSRGMSAIVDMHHYEELMKQPDAHAARFVALWQQIAARLRGRPAGVVYEILNEPTDKLTGERWNALSLEALRAVRAIDPQRTIIVDSVFWASAEELDKSLRLPEGDPHLVGSFHMYQPILFTHQGMSWMPPEFGTVGVVFPGPPRSPLDPSPAAQGVQWVADWFRRYNTLPAEQNPSGPAVVAEQLGHACAFVARTGLPVYMGEFGAADRGDAASRVTWTRMVRAEAERRGIGWAYWDDGGSFKVYDQKARTWNPELRAALLQ
jgi:endoglucanase